MVHCHVLRLAHISANRLYVHEKVYDTFTELLKKRVSEFKLGFGLDPSTTQGPLVNALAVRKVLEHVNDAKSKGAQVVLGGKAPNDLKGFFFEPTIITGVTKDMTVSHEETFGPLAPLFKFSSDAEVIEMANDTEFGLAGYFFSKDFNRIWRVAAALECGMVGVNTGKISAPESPFGGVRSFVLSVTNPQVKESGVGREGSKYGIAEFQNIKAIIVGNLDP
jgi:succinate-semialdehyde dehydrogenase / glutarate-semialdehyde dehydrogenase